MPRDHENGDKITTIDQLGLKFAPATSTDRPSTAIDDDAIARTLQKYGIPLERAGLAFQQRVRQSQVTAQREATARLARALAVHQKLEAPQAENRSTAQPQRFFHGGAAHLRVGDDILPAATTGVASSSSRTNDERHYAYVTPLAFVAAQFACRHPNGKIYVVRPRGHLDADTPKGGTPHRGAMLAFKCAAATITAVYGSLADYADGWAFMTAMWEKAGRPCAGGLERAMVMPAHRGLAFFETWLLGWHACSERWEYAGRADHVGPPPGWSQSTVWAADAPITTGHAHSHRKP